MDEIWVCHLGPTPYAEAHRLQQRLRTARQAELIPDVMLMLEHPPVYTRGRRSQAGELPFGASWYRDRGIEIVDTDRGGRLTYHGPGQLVGYPIMRTRDVIAYLRTMEEAIIAALAGEGIEAGLRDGLTGVWVADRKIASIGVHLSRGVTTHGFAVNVENDLEPFSWVVPCGIDGVQMTSIAAETGRTRALPCFRRRMAYTFAQANARRQRLVSLARVESRLATVADAQPPPLVGHAA
jgi:lipoyl(octanoyl) transferase